MLTWSPVVLGGGTAGLVVAARLTENPEVTVGVLEAGPNKLDDILIDTPGLFPQLLNNPAYDWRFHSVPQKHGLSKRHNMPRGKVLGGSSALNFEMVSSSTIELCVDRLG